MPGETGVLNTSIQPIPTTIAAGFNLALLQSLKANETASRWSLTIQHHQQPAWSFHIWTGRATTRSCYGK